MSILIEDGQVITAGLTLNQIKHYADFDPSRLIGEGITLSSLIDELISLEDEVEYHTAEQFDELQTEVDQADEALETADQLNDKLQERIDSIGAAAKCIMSEADIILTNLECEDD